MLKSENSVKLRSLMKSNVWRIKVVEMFSKLSIFWQFSWFGLKIQNYFSNFHNSFANHIFNNVFNSEGRVVGAQLFFFRIEWFWTFYFLFQQFLISCECFFYLHHATHCSPRLLCIYCWVQRCHKCDEFKQKHKSHREERKQKMVEGIKTSSHSSVNEVHIWQFK